MDSTKDLLAKATFEEQGIHIPFRDYVEKVLASHFSRNKMPDMSGDQRKRLTAQELRQVQSAADVLIEKFAGILTQAAKDLEKELKEDVGPTPKSD